ncbi:hypothetical protein [Thalassoroseus pseudoceratinae]|uniref:hypothetical protein n=1 Tax=Thalassoroseus pseudoceratinae TaxID=2713176 RepID=UPI00142382CD|nr:hypothetical protein [Thalassoroseus pseudoceratinae]
MQAAGLGGVGVSIGGATGMSAASGVSMPSAGTQTVSATSQPNTAAQTSRPPETVAELNERIDPGRMQELMEQLEGFSSAEIIIALMMMSRSKDDEQKSGGSDLLAGLLISQSFLGMNSASSNSSNMVSPVSSAGHVGGQLDISL